MKSSVLLLVEEIKNEGIERSANYKEFFYQLVRYSILYSISSLNKHGFFLLEKTVFFLFSCFVDFRFVTLLLV